MRRTTTVGVVLLALAASAGCRKAGKDQRTDAITPEEIAQARADWPAAVAAHVDSGNAAYGAQDYEAAARHYRRAAELGPQVTAAWFGIYISEHARGNIDAADSALRRARELAPRGLPLHPARADTIRREP